MWICRECKTEHADQVKYCISCGKTKEEIGYYPPPPKGIIKRQRKNRLNQKVGWKTIVLAFAILAVYLGIETYKMMYEDVPDNLANNEYWQKADQSERNRMFNEALTEEEKKELGEIGMKVVFSAGKYLDKKEQKRFYELIGKGDNASKTETSQMEKLFDLIVSRIQDKGSPEEKKLVSRYLEIHENTEKKILENIYKMSKKVK